MREYQIMALRARLAFNARNLRGTGWGWSNAQIRAYILEAMVGVPWGGMNPAKRDRWYGQRVRT